MQDMDELPDGTAWVLYFDKDGEFLEAKTYDPEQGSLQPAPVNFNVPTVPPPDYYQFLGSKPLGEWYFYRDRSDNTVRGCYHRYNCDLRCR
jgi:hypothetical protein